MQYSPKSQKKRKIQKIHDVFNKIKSDKLPGIQFIHDKKESKGLINWGVFGGVLERDGVTVIFDGYLLDDYTLSAQEQVIQLHHEFLSKGIDFIKHRNFFGNILFDTKDCVYVVSSQHALFHLFYTVNDDSSFDWDIIEISKTVTLAFFAIL